jgi:antirestriction protein ArdC
MNVYEIVTNRIIESLQGGIIPWQKPWKAGARHPKNLLTKKAYRGINVLLLWPGQFASPYWVTFRQALALGGGVHKGQKGTPIVFWKVGKREEEPDGPEAETSLSFILRYYTVFNVEQCDGLTVPAVEGTAAQIDPIEHCEQLISDWSGKPTMTPNNPDEYRAYYRPHTDSVHMPLRNRFIDAPHYYATLFHELVHSTGHEKRLNRTNFIGSFGDHNYSKEELVAETGSAFLCAIAGISNEHIEQNTTAYIQSWIRMLKSDSKMIVQAAAQAQKAADMILMIPSDCESAEETES